MKYSAQGSLNIIIYGAFVFSLTTRLTPCVSSVHSFKPRTNNRMECRFYKNSRGLCLWCKSIHVFY